MANDAYFKPSLHVDKFVPEDYSLDTERFLVFLRAYYEWLQTTKITITGLSGTFERDETVTATDGAIGIIKEVGSGYIIVKMTSRLPFNRRQTITGGTSDATATISTIKDNVIRASGNLQNYKNFELSIDKYFEYLKDELYPSLPASVYGDKRLLATKYKDFFETKSNEESYRFLFRHLYNEEIEFYYPGEDVLRASDGNFDKPQVLRAVITDDIFDFLNKTIRGTTSGSLANVIDIKVFTTGSIEIAEMTLKLVSGTFLASESIVDIDNEALTTTLYGMITGFTINDGGSGYQQGDTLTVSGDGSGAEIVVSSIQDSPITSLLVNEIGYGYRVGTTATINNSGTGGSGLIVRVTEIANTYSAGGYTVGEISTVSIINRGENYYKSPTITIEDTTISSLGLLSADLITIANSGIDYGVGNTLVFTGGSGSSAAGIVAAVEETTTYDLLFEDGMRMISEDSYYDIIKNEDWAVLGPIARLELTNFGTGYESANLPSITVSTTTGSSANLIATNIQGKSANVSVDVANNETGIGSIRSIDIINFGVEYTSATVDATGSGDGNANITPIVTGSATNQGNWIDDDGKLDYKYLQDSYFYQDFSYVIKSGLAFSSYKDMLKKIIHPAGLQPFGEIVLFGTLDVSADFKVEIEIRKVLDFILQIFSEIDVSFAGVNNVTYELELKPFLNITSDVLDRRLEVSKSSLIDEEIQVSKEDTIFLGKNVLTLSPSIEKQFTYPVETTFQAYGQLYRELAISVLASEQIGDFASITFNDEYISTVQVDTKATKNIKIAGTVTISGNVVVGTSTDFSNAYSVDDSFIVNGEKFIVKSIANTEYLVLNVVPTGTYINSDAYKEQSV